MCILSCGTLLTFKMASISSCLHMLLVFCCAVILVNSEYTKKCGDRWVNRGPFCCDPIFNCAPGHEIVPCTKDYEPETCRNCSDNKVQPDHISSLDKERSCFARHRHCTATDLTFARKKDTLFQPQGCKCDINACFIEQNRACKRINGCGKGQEPDPKTGDCRPCPADKYKLHDGCSPCITNKTLWLKQFSKETVTGPIPKEKTLISCSHLYIIIGVAVLSAVILLVAFVICIISFRRFSWKREHRYGNGMENGRLLQNESNCTETNTMETTVNVNSTPPFSGQEKRNTNTCSAINMNNDNINRNNLSQPNGSAHHEKRMPSTSTDNSTNTFSTNPGASARQIQIGTAMKIIGPRGSTDESVGTASLSSTMENEVVFTGSPSQHEEEHHHTNSKYV